MLNVIAFAWSYIVPLLLIAWAVSKLWKGK